MSAGAAQKQTMHRDDSDWRGGGGHQIMKPALFISLPAQNHRPEAGNAQPSLAREGVDEVDGWDD